MVLFLISCLVIAKSFSWDTSAKTTSWICSSCLKICRKTFVGILHPWIATVISSECSFLLTSNNFWSQTRYSEAALMLLSHYVSIYSFFGHIFLYFYFSLDYFYLSTQCICLLNLHCQRWSSFQIFAFYTFLHALGAGYRRKAKALGKHCLYKYHKYRITLSLDICEFKNINLLKQDIWDYFKFSHILSLQRIWKY